MEQGPRPVPEGEEPGAAPRAAAPGGRARVVEEGVKLDAPVSVQENVKLAALSAGRPAAMRGRRRGPHSSRTE